jgi:membrane protein required for colicin V production
MNWLDGVIAVMMLLSIIFSVQKGFSREVIGLVAAFFGLILGSWFYGVAGAWLEPYVSSIRVAHFLGFLLVFVGVLIAGGLLGWIVSRFLKNVGLSWVDRAMGAAFGIVRGLVLSVALVMILVAFAPGSTEAAPPQAVVHSHLAPYVIGASKVLTQLAPHDLKDDFQKRYDEVKRAWDGKTAPAAPERN